MNQKPLIIGWNEWLALPDLGVARVHAKTDTGAKTSALHVEFAGDYQHPDYPEEHWVEFGVLDDQGKLNVRHCVARVVDSRDVKNSFGQVEHRVVIRTGLRFGTAENPLLETEIDLTLTDRSSMRFSMLLGREAMRGLVWVDPSRALLVSKAMVVD